MWPPHPRGLSLPLTVERPNRSRFDQLGGGLFPQFAPGLDEQPGDEGIDLRAIPVRVTDLVIRTGRHQQLALVIRTAGKRFSVTMVKVTEPPLQSPRHIRLGAAPTPVSTQRPQLRQVVLVAQRLQNEVRSWGRRLANRKAGMLLAIDDQHRQPAFPQQQPQQAARETGTENGDIEEARHAGSLPDRDELL